MQATLPQLQRFQRFGEREFATKGGLEEQLNRVANGPLLGRLIKGKGKVCDSGTFQLCKGVHQFFMDLSDVTTARSYHETDWFKALRHQTRRQNTLSNANFGQLVFRCFSAFCGIMAAAWDHLTEKLVQEVDRVLRAMAKLKVTEDVRAVSDFFLVRCLLHILNTCFSEHRPDVGRRTCNPPKVIAELLRTVLGSAGNKIRPVLIDQISYLPFHPSKHVRDIMSHVMTQYERPLSDIGVTHAEHHLAVASIRSGELTEDVVQEKGRPSCTWQKMEWRGPDNERLQGAMFVPQPKCLTANNRIEGCLKHATPSQQNEQHVQNLDMLHKFGSDPGAPYFLTLLAFQFHPMPCFYITENVDNKRLLCLLLDSREKKHWLSMTSLLNAACDVTAALTFLAERNIALRDVTTFNMICVTGPRGVVTRRSVKLADLGLSHEFCSESPYDNPEIRRYGVYHLIRHCTELRPDDRPKLEQVHSTLQRLMNTTTPEEPPNRNPDRYKNLRESSWVTSLNANVTDAELVPDAISVKKQEVLLARIGRIRQLSGLSYVIDEVFQDSKRWLSPEVLHNGIYTKENDIFMLGTTFWELFNARNRCGRDPAATARDLVPLVEFSKDQVADMVQEGVLLPEPPEIPSWLYNLICDCRHPDRKERPTIQRVISCLEEHCSADCSQLVAYMSRDVDSWPGPDDEAPSVPSRDSRWLLAKLGNSFKRRRTRVVSGQQAFSIDEIPQLPIPASKADRTADSVREKIGSSTALSN
nr:hypothetical protein BaRGS_018919 [Batillaria attramentaria]